MLTKAREMSEALLDKFSMFLQTCNGESVYGAFLDDAVDCRCCLEYTMYGPEGAGFGLSSKGGMHQMGAGRRKRRFLFICNCSVICFSSFKHGILDLCIRYIGIRIPHRSSLIFIHWTVTMHLVCADEISNERARTLGAQMWGRNRLDQPVGELDFLAGWVGWLMA